MTKEQFIEEVAKYVKKYASEYNIKVYSPIIAQACLESNYGTSNKVRSAKGEWRHNYFGLKWRDKRCAVSNEWFVEVGSEQDPNTKQYISNDMKWCKFNSLEECVLGYFQWTNIKNYANLKNVTDPETYVRNIKEDKYATSVDYVDKIMNVIKKWNLTKYDPEVKYFRVQVGAYKNKALAENMQGKLLQHGFKSILKYENCMYKVQVAACRYKDNAEKIARELANNGFNNFIVYS